MDKIYSRKRIKLPKLSKIKMFILLVLICIITFIVSFIYASYPIFIATCNSAAASKAVNIMTEEVHLVMEKYNYDDLINIEKDENGNVILLKSNTILINKITSKISQNIQKQIDNSPTIIVYINYGSVSGISKLKFFGPKFNIELENAGRVNCKVKSKFESAGINQTLHRIYLDLNTKIGILTPMGSFGETANTSVLLTEAIIVGKIPESYYNFDGLDKTDALNVVE